MNNKVLHIIVLTVGILCISCQHQTKYFPREKDLEHVSVDIIRFDNALMNVREESAPDDIRYLYDEYPDFMPHFVEDIIGIPTTDTTYLAQALIQFLNDTTYGFKETNLREKQLFSQIDDIEADINQAFSRIHYLYPDWEIPTLYLIISGFNAGIWMIADYIAIGADMYLGSDYEYYNRVVYDYQKLTMRKECIPADVVSAYLFHNIEYTSSTNRLIDNMIYRGKIMYLLSLIMSDEKKYEVMGYTKQQWDWCKKYEKQIWNMVMDKRDLFKTESLVLTSYLNDGPFTAEISQDAPARLGTWLGWQITESYMKHNPDVTLQQLMANGDAQEILENSYYRP